MSYVDKYVSMELSTRDIARDIGVSMQVLLRWMDDLGVERSNKSHFQSIKSSGRTSNRKGVKLTDETRARLSRLATGRIRNVGSKRSDEAKKKMSDSAKRRWAEHPDRHEHKRRMAEARAASKLPADELDARNKTRQAMKTMLRRVLTMTRARKDKKSESILGYTKEELRSHLESQFKDGMSWSDRASFHIDHIIPVAYYLRNGITDPAVINALSNLQVLTPEENRQKSDSFTDAPRRQALVIDSSGTRSA